MRKKAKEAKTYTQALREVKCAYMKKNEFSLVVNRAMLEAFWISLPGSRLRSPEKRQKTKIVKISASKASPAVVYNHKCIYTAHYVSKKFVVDLCKISHNRIGLGYHDTRA